MMTFKTATSLRATVSERRCSVCGITEKALGYDLQIAIVPPCLGVLKKCVGARLLVCSQGEVWDWVNAQIDGAGPDFWTPSDFVGGVR